MTKPMTAEEFIEATAVNHPECEQLHMCVECITFAEAWEQQIRAAAAAKERERILQSENVSPQFLAEVREKERERCAAVCIGIAHKCQEAGQEFAGLDVHKQIWAARAEELVHAAAALRALGDAEKKGMQ